MRKFSITFILFYVALTASVLAQKGYLRGKVIDGETGEALIGATVSRQGTTTGTVADFEGNYSLPLDAGTHTIVFQFVSYQTKTVENVEIVAGQVNTMDITLSTDVEQLAEVVVTAEVIKDSEAAILTLQKKSANVLDGMSSQTFRKIGDSNLSGAIKRVTGVSIQGGRYVYVRGLGDRYNRTTLNGMSIPGLDPDRNDVQIDLFPTSVLENVIVYKTFSPELAGDFTGGTVNVETKSFPEEKTTSVSLGFGYNPKMNLNGDFLSYEGGKTDLLGFDDGTRELPLDDPTSSFENPNIATNPGPTIDATKRLDPNMDAIRKNSFLNTSFSINHGNQLDKGNYKLGYGLVLNYQNQYEYYEDAEWGYYFKDANKDIYQLDAQRIRNGDLGRNDILWSSLLTGAIKTNRHEVGLTFFRTQNAVVEATSRISRDLEETGQTAYQDVLTYSQRSITSPSIYGKHNFNKITLEWNNTFTWARVYDPDYREALIAEVDQVGEDGQPLYSIDGGDGGRVSRFWRDMNENNESARIDATYEFGDNNKLKFGAAALLKWREFETYAFSLQNKGIVQNNPDYLLQEENIWNAQTEEGTYIQGGYEAANNYDARSAVYSAYGMGDIFLHSSVRAIFGLRVEQAYMNYTGQDNSGIVVYDDERTLDKLNFLPSVNFVFSLTDDMNIRTSYGRTVARPSFREKSIAQILDPITGIRYSGNIDLEQTDVDNFDLRVENFFGRDQMIAVSGFYKKFSGHIEMVRFQTEPTEVTWRNIGGSQVYGIEVEGRKRLGFIEGLSAGTNVTLAASKVDMTEIVVLEDGVTGEITSEFESRVEQARTGEDVDEDRVMAGQAPFLINTYLNFSDAEGNTNFNLSYNVQGESLAVVGVGQVPDVYVKPFHSLNLNASRKIGASKKSQLTMRVDNILGDSKDQVWKNYKADEQIFTSFDTGRTFTIKYSYNF
ncbi:TonB-dependent receptor [Fulvivirga kasyanovii]|uniref:TonB-dependent receptor n=1 Tax=Fulvivirga kasyanovii TaxID=396812 RepID=A0ABW9RJA0_9BACT|nr:TonB-dependent receptor [Fulvivirga kasyanovii]MTI24157.1 TonB-dependent receptor [Fulvivirga kasyanovii]